MAFAGLYIGLTPGVPVVDITDCSLMDLDAEFLQGGTAQKFPWNVLELLFTFGILDATMAEEKWGLWYD